MRQRSGAAVLLLAAACGGPVLAGAPHPNSAIVAGAAAAAAAAITIANPALAGHKPEADVDGTDRPVPVQGTIPGDVFDRAEQPQPAAPTEPPAAQP